MKAIGWLRPVFTTVSLFTLALLSTFVAATSAFAGKPGPALNPRTVCIDAGHGGNDSGASWYGLDEKHLTLEIARLLRTSLQNTAQFTVVMTRDGDISLGNTDRANICNAAGADTVLSIHLNASTNTSVDYFIAFYGKQTKDGEFTRTIWENYKLLKPDKSGPLPKNNPTQFASGLLLKTNAPAALAETVFLSYEPEANLLRAGSRQQEIATELHNGLVAWYTKRGLLP